MNLKGHGCKPHSCFYMEIKPANAYKYLSFISISNQLNAWSQLCFTLCKYWQRFFPRRDSNPWPHAYEPLVSLDESFRNMNVITLRLNDLWYRRPMEKKCLHTFDCHRSVNRKSIPGVRLVLAPDVPTLRPSPQLPHCKC